MNESAQRYYVVDAFTSRPFSGNPAAVVPLNQWPEDAWLQNVALEMNLSETAFIVPNAEGYDLRWFTPKVEVDLCGHATLATAFILSHEGKLANGETVQFTTRSGTLTAKRQGSSIELDLPLTVETPTEAPSGLSESLGIAPSYVGRSKFDYLVEVEAENVLRSMTPDFRRLAAVECRGVIVTCRSTDLQFDFLSRFFAPAAGIDEDPVTGSAHCCLAPYWGQRLNKARLIGYQASARGGTVHVEIKGERVVLGGEAVMVARGRLLID